jgi:hypothetical protein
MSCAARNAIRFAGVRNREVSGLVGGLGWAAVGTFRRDFPSLRLRDSERFR